MNADVDEITEPSLSTMRTLVRHERGTMLVIAVLLAGVLCCLVTYYVQLLGHKQVYATPDIYREQPVEIVWGSHGK